MKPGEQAPPFDLPGSDGRRHALADYRGRPLVVFFYPKAMTPGCTRETRAFAERYPEFRALGAEVLGISADPPEVQARFAEKLAVPFPLLSDPEARVIRAWGAYGTKNFYGKKREGTLRHTYVLDGEGRVVAAIRRAKPEEHPEKALRALAEVAGGPGSV